MRSTFTTILAVLAFSATAAAADVAPPPATTPPPATDATAPAATAPKAVDVTKAGPVDCSKTPAVNIKGAKLKVALSGNCTDVTLAGAQGEIVADSIVNLTVSGAQNNVVVSRVDNINLSGNKNNVTWTGCVDPAKTAPVISDKGKENAVKSGAAAAVDAAKKVDPKKASADANKATKDASKSVGDGMKKLGLGGH